MQEQMAVLEAKRQKVLRRLKVMIITSVIGLVLLYFIGRYFWDVQMIFVIMFVAIVLIIVVTADGNNRFRIHFKKELMPKLIQLMGNSIQYEFRQGITQEQCMSAKLFKRPDRYYAEDLIYGSIEGVRFSTSDVRMEERIVSHNNGKRHVRYQPFFTGRWYLFDFNKSFNGMIQVREDGLFEGPKWRLRLSRVEMEDVTFNKTFRTYATNDYDAFYILTPPIMESMKQLERNHPGKMYFSFIDNRLTIAINGAQNSFEPSLFRPIDQSFIAEQLADIKMIQSIVHELRLNKNIFK